MRRYGDIMSYNEDAIECWLCEQIKSYEHFTVIKLPNAINTEADICDDCVKAITDGKPHAKRLIDSIDGVSKTYGIGF